MPEHPSKTEAPDNSKLRAAMDHFVVTGDMPCDDLVAHILAEETFVLVPMFVDPVDPDAGACFTTITGGEGDVLHVYTTRAELPELDADNTIMPLNLGELIWQLMHEDYNGLIIDAGTPHGVCVHFSEGGCSLHSYTKLQASLRDLPAK